ncbi:MAG: DNA-processing protein DprA [Peptococcia bacterium]
MEKERRCILALHKIFGINLNQYFEKIKHYYGSFAAAWGAADLPIALGLSEKLRDVYEKLKDAISPEQLEQEYLAKGIKYLTRLDQDYPFFLLQISNIPCILYYCGDTSLLHNNCLAVVGSRQASVYGTRQAKLFSAELSKNGLTIVSGLARGIDTAAHEGALEGKGSTVAVLGAGLDEPYPRENIRLFRSICEKGLVISEYPPGTKPLNYHFPIRNRIISGLSLGVFVVEAKARSGSLITCDLALEQGKEVFSLPGVVTSPNSIGSLRLIQQGAKLVIYPQDILEELGYEYQADVYNKQKAKISTIDQTEKTIYHQISWDPVNIDFLLEKFPDQQEMVMRILLELELKGLIRQLPGKYYVRV